VSHRTTDQLKIHSKYSFTGIHLNSTEHILKKNLRLKIIRFHRILIHFSENLIKIYYLKTTFVHSNFFFNGMPLFYQCSRTVGVPLNLPVIPVNGVELLNFLYFHLKSMVFN
jgi:hypothetical protein